MPLAVRQNGYMVMDKEQPQEEVATTRSYAGEMLEPAFVAKLLKVDRATVILWVKQGTLDGIKLPSKANAKRHRYRVFGSSVDKLLSQ